MSETLTILTCDGVKHVVDRTAAMMNVTIKDMVEDLGECDEAIPLPNVASGAFEKLMEFCMHYKDRPLVDGKMEADKDFDDKLLAFSNESFQHGDFLELLLASNYASNSLLLGACCDRIADAISGKDVNGVREFAGMCTECHIENEDDEEKCKHGKTKIRFTPEVDEKLDNIKTHAEWEEWNANRT